MKPRFSFYLIVLLANLLPRLVWGQCDGNVTVTLNSQAAVEAFGASGCTGVGALIIEGADITNLSSLSALTRIGPENGTSFVKITNNPLLSSLSGLNNATGIVRELTIKNNASLRDVSALTNLSEDYNFLEITNNDALTNLNGFNKLTETNALLAINDNDALTDLSALSSLTLVRSLLEIINNDALISLNGLQNLTWVGRTFTISGNAKLSDMSALSRLTTIRKDLNIDNNPALTNLNGLNNLTRVGDLVGDGSLFITNNEALNDISALAKLTIVSEDLTIKGNSALANLNGLNNITTLNRNLTIESNSALTTLNGLNNLTSIGAYVKIKYNERLNDISALTSLTTLTGNLTIEDNPTLTNLNGLNNLISIKAIFFGPGFEIKNNKMLTNINALTSLTTLGGSLTIQGNPALTNLNGLNNLTSIERGLRIVDNPQLSACAIASICQYLTNPPGEVTISGNATGCASPEEVRADCVPLAITGQPSASSTVCAGSPVTTTVSTTGNVRSYQWYLGEQPVSGQTSATLTLTSVQSQDAGVYRVVVANSVSSLTSTAFTLTVNPLPPTPTLVTQSGQSVVSVTQNAPPVVLIAGGCVGGTITWSGSNNTSGRGNITVPTSTTGTFVYQATCQLGQCTSVPASATVTVTVPPVTLRVLHQNADNNQPQNNIIKPYLQLQNDGTSAIPYGEITLRYWLTVEEFAPMTNLSVYYAQLGSSKVKMTYVELPQPRQGALGYIEYRFETSAGSLGAGANSGPIQTGIGKQDWTPVNEADDHSYANTSSYAPNVRITAYRNGALVWGSEPQEVAPVRSLKVYTENKNGPSTNTISTYLQLRNEGNLPVSYSDVKVRYYFTSEGSQPLNFYLDYAVLGSNKAAGAPVKGQLVKINPPLANADTYLELSFQNLERLYPLSGTGNIQYRIAKSDWSNFSQSNDHSYQNGSQPLGENNRVVVYVGGVRVYGTEPGAGARLAAEGEEVPLSVLVLGNPVTGSAVSVEVRGAEGEPLRLQLTDLTGRAVSERVVGRAEAVERQTLDLGSQPAGLLLLRVSTPGQTQTIRVLRRN